jgi:hypothetical protein
VRSASAALRRPDAARVRGPGECHPLPNSRGDQLRTARTRQSIPSLVRTISVIGTPASANTCGGLRVRRSAPRGRVTCSRSRAPSPEDSPTGKAVVDEARVTIGSANPLGLADCRRGIRDSTQRQGRNHCVDAASGEMKSLTASMTSAARSARTLWRPCLTENATGIGFPVAS